MGSPVSLQTRSDWPAWHWPLLQQPMDCGEHACAYLPGRAARIRAIACDALDADVFQILLDAGCRRSGRIIYQPTCAGCRSCVPMRVPVRAFEMTKSQRRVWRRNEDVTVRMGVPTPTTEKWEMYAAYQAEWHDGQQSTDPASFLEFLYDSPTSTMEFEYLDAGGKLLGVGICDVTMAAISSVYFYFDPACAERSLGTYSALYELHWARERQLAHWYAGYWVPGCGKMEYKTRFRPFELLGTDGVWRSGRSEKGD